MRLLMLSVLAALLGACGTDRKAAPDARCTAFAERVAACGFASSVTPPLTDEERRNVRGVAYAVCTKTTDDEAKLEYYGDVDRKIECMQDQDCDGVRTCLFAPD